MDQIYPDNGLEYIITQLIQGSGSGLWWKLFTNNIVPSLNDTIADYTLPGGWCSQQVAPSAFTNNNLVAHVDSLQAPNITFTNTGSTSVTVYGYIITDPSGTELIAAARFDGSTPPVIPPAGSQVVTPIFGVFSALQA